VGGIKELVAPTGVIKRLVGTSFAGPDVDMLPVERDAGLGDRPAPSPSQPVDERQAPPGGFEEV